MSNLIKERDARTKKRQKAKDKIDKKVSFASFLPDMDTKNVATLALSRSEGTVRLLDECAIVTASGKVDLYIEKGAIKKFATGKNKYLTPEYLVGDADLAKQYFGGDVTQPMNIDDKYEGTINIGHNDFASFPVGIVGSWKQEDLTVVDNGDGRKGLDVDLKLNEAHPLVQALRVQGIPVGVSVEMYLHWDDKGTEKLAEEVPEEQQTWFMGAVDEIFIKDFAIVGECGNVGSSGSVDLQGVEMDEPVKTTEDMRDAELEETAEENEMPESEVDTVEEVAEETTEEATEETTEEPDEEEETETEDESVEEEVDDEAESEEVEDEEDALAVAEERITAQEAEIATLKETIETLKKSNAKKDKKIREYAERDEAFKRKFKGLDVSLGVTKETNKKVLVSNELYATGDGIGELQCLKTYLLSCLKK